MVKLFYILFHLFSCFILILFYYLLNLVYEIPHSSSSSQDFHKDTSSIFQTIKYPHMPQIFYLKADQQTQPFPFQTVSITSLNLVFKYNAYKTGIISIFLLLFLRIIPPNTGILMVEFSLLFYIWNLSMGLETHGGI